MIKCQVRTTTIRSTKAGILIGGCADSRHNILTLGEQREDQLLFFLEIQILYMSQWRVGRWTGGRVSNLSNYLVITTELTIITRARGRPLWVWATRAAMLIILNINLIINILICKNTRTEECAGRVLQYLIPCLMLRHVTCDGPNIVWGMRLKYLHTENILQKFRGYNKISLETEKNVRRKWN